MVGMDMEFYHANSHEIISLEKWNGQNGQNGKWSTELTYYSQRVHGISAFKGRPKQAMGLRFKSFVNKINPLLYHEFVYSDPRK